jgi:hypothetical protein|tara:strand:- start:221 stop:454 length:234 start_codon:yes stop_codon:yes gene_type:complete
MRKVRFKFKRNAGVWGLAFVEQHRIELDPYLDDKTLIDIAIHETTHVVAPDLSEECVDRIGRACADVLWRLKFRREE